MSVPALERVIARAGARGGAVERCDMCAVAVAAQHRHALDIQRAELMCLCRACALLFRQDAASVGHYRLIPERRLRLGEFDTAELGVPVGLAYFTVRDDGAVIARYPNPLGAAEWEVAAASWAAVAERCPPLVGLLEHVEALLVNTARGASERWIVPIDDCFRLIALIGREWVGLSGGSRVWPQIEAFFAALKEEVHG